MNKKRYPSPIYRVSPPQSPPHHPKQRPICTPSYSKNRNSDFTNYQQISPPISPPISPQSNKRRCVQSSRAPAHQKLANNWITSLNEVILPHKRSSSVSPNAYLLFPSPTSPTTRTPRTLRKIIDDSGFRVLKESPLSARDSYYACDLDDDQLFREGHSNINSTSNNQQKQILVNNGYSIVPSPRPMSMRNLPNMNRNGALELNQQNQLPFITSTGNNSNNIGKCAKSERKQRPHFDLDANNNTNSNSTNKNNELVSDLNDCNGKCNQVDRNIVNNRIKTKEARKAEIDKLFDLSEFNFDKLEVNKEDSDESGAALMMTNEDIHLSNIALLSASQSNAELVNDVSPPKKPESGRKSVRFILPSDHS